MKKKILIFYTSVGLGHKSIAENIGEQLETVGYEVILSDILKVQAGLLVDISKKIHFFVITKIPWLWSFLYMSNIFTSLALPVRTWVARRNYGNTLSLINLDKPDLVITTQTSASAVLSVLKQKGLYKEAWGIAFSDFHLHRFWLYDNADFYLVNIEEQKQEMQTLGISEDKIFVVGMTLSPEKNFDISAVKQKLNIPQENKVVLVGSGSLGTGIPEKVVEKLTSLKQVSVILVNGKNKASYNLFQEKFKLKNFIVLSFYSPMEELYTVADIYITKPGGLTTAESLRYRIPLLVTHYLPGQEELNINYLKKLNLILLPGDSLMQVLERELNSGEFRDQLFGNMGVRTILGQPESLFSAVKQVLHD